MGSGRRPNKVVKHIEALEPVAIENGFEIVDAEVTGNAKSPILRIYLDKEDGITLDDISEAQQGWLEAIVDEVDIIAGEYILEVSSPGIDRPLRTRAHFEDFAGEEVKLTTEPIDGRRKFGGTLEGMEGDDVIIVTEEGERLAIPFEAVQKAKTIGKVDFNRNVEFGEEEN